VLALGSGEPGVARARAALAAPAAKQGQWAPARGLDFVVAEVVGAQHATSVRRRRELKLDVAIGDGPSKILAADTGNRADKGTPSFVSHLDSITWCADNSGRSCASTPSCPATGHFPLSPGTATVVSKGYVSYRR